MAPRKRNSRTPKRASKRKVKSGSGTPMVALAALVALGGFSLWVTATHKSPTEAVSSLFQGTVSSLKPQSTTTSARQEVTKPEPRKTVAAKPRENDFPPAVSPVPRPTTAIKPPRPQSAPEQRKIAPVPAKQIAAPLGTNTPAYSPSVVYARKTLTIRKTAWDKSPAVGTVEKGREMRSYEKTGRWHRVAVPTTNLIGWVHEDHLVGGKKKPQRAEIITGSINQKPQVSDSKKPQTASTQRPKPPLAVGAQN